MNIKDEFNQINLELTENKNDICNKINEKISQTQNQIENKLKKENIVVKVKLNINIFLCFAFIHDNENVFGKNL